MEKDDDKRILDGPITGSMRTDHPSPQSIGNLRERYAIHEKMTTQKPTVSFDTVMEDVARDTQPSTESSVSAASDRQQGDQPQGDAYEAAPSQATATQEADVFERAPAGKLRQTPLPSGRHPDTPTPGGRGKVIIKA